MYNFLTYEESIKPVIDPFYDANKIVRFVVVHPVPISLLDL